MSRCWACCQENCGYGPCSCTCHAPSQDDLKVGKVSSDRPMLGLDPMCDRCGLRRAHFCPGRRKLPISCDPLPDIRLEDVFDVILPPKCKKHRQYKAIRRPRTACEPCWRLWIAIHPA